MKCWTVDCDITSNIIMKHDTNAAATNAATQAEEILCMLVPSLILADKWYIPHFSKTPIRGLRDFRLQKWSLSYIRDWYKNIVVGNYLAITPRTAAQRHPHCSPQRLLHNGHGVMMKLEVFHHYG